MCFSLWGLERHMVKSRLPRLLIGTKWRSAEGRQGRSNSPSAILLRKRPVWSAGATLHSFLKATHSELDLNSCLTPGRILAWRALRDARETTALKVTASRLTRHTFCGQSSVDGAASASRRGVAEWHFHNDGWTRPLMALPRMHLDVCLMPVEAEQRWAREQITQLTSALHQSGSCGMLNGYFHLLSTCYDDF